MSTKRKNTQHLHENNNKGTTTSPSKHENEKYCQVAENKRKP